VDVEVIGNGSDRRVLITLTDQYGTYVHEAKYDNGTTLETYIVEGEHGDYTLKIEFHGNEFLDVREMTYEERATDYSDFYVASARAVVAGNGNNRSITITVTDAFGTYEQTFGLANGAALASYTIKGEYGYYCVEVNIQGNSVRGITIVSYELDVDIGATVYAIVTGSGSGRMVTITLTDALGNHTKSFPYANGTADGIYSIAVSNGEYIVYVTYKGNSVQTVAIVEFK